MVCFSGNPDTSGISLVQTGTASDCTYEVNYTKAGDYVVSCTTSDAKGNEVTHQVDITANMGM